MQILIIESDTSCAEALSFALANAGFGVGHRRTAQAGIEALCGDHTADGVVVGHPLSDMAGIDVCRAIQHRDLGLIMVTACTREETVLRAFAAGADDVMVKPVRLAELVARLAAILRRRGAGANGDHGAVMEKGPFRLHSHRLEVHISGRPEPARLTPLEAKLLGLLMLNANQVMTKARLQELIWGYQNDSSGDLLKTHVRHLRVKLEASPSLPRYIQTINGIGYTFVSPRATPTTELAAPDADLTVGVPSARAASPLPFFDSRSPSSR